MPVVLIDQTALPHRRELWFAGAACDLSTNSAALASVLEDLSTSARDSGVSRFSMQIVVNEGVKESAGSPHFRGLHHIVTASFGSSNVFVFDLLRWSLSASVSASVARDIRFWKERLIPITLGVLGAAIGLVPVHCACLASKGDGLLIAGMSGAGKSTLSMALTQTGFNYVSDDWTYMSAQGGQLVAHGTSAPVKLLPDAVQHFQSLSSHSLQTSMNGELAYEVDVLQAFGASVERACEPRWLVLLERIQQAGCEFARMPSTEAQEYLNSTVERLPTQLPEASVRRAQIIESISLLPCWSLRYGGPPQFAAKQLREFVACQRQGVYV